MYPKSPLSLKGLIHQAFKNTKYQHVWLQSILTTAWHQLFPQWKNEIKKLFIKEKVLHIELNSVILSNELRSNQDIVLEALQKEMQDLGYPGDDVQKILFL